MRLAAALIVLCAGLAAGCGGSGGGAGPDAGATLRQLYDEPGDDVAVIPGTSDYGPGENRVSFLVADEAGSLVTAPTATVWIARGLDDVPFQQVTASSEPIGVPGGATADAAEIYVAHVRVPGPGTYWFLAQPEGGTAVQALGNLVVGRRPVAPAVGDEAIPSDTPTLADVGGDVSAISTANPPNPELLRVSVADALAAREPFVVTFATPQFCQSRTCGPVVQVVQSVAAGLRERGIRFVHVEIFEDNDPAKGVNRWVKEWRLPTEPFTYVVDREGVIRARFEGAFSEGELRDAVAKVAPAR